MGSRPLRPIGGLPGHLPIDGLPRGFSRMLSPKNSHQGPPRPMLLDFLAQLRLSLILAGLLGGVLHGCGQGPSGAPGPATRIAVGSGFDADVMELIGQLADAVDAAPLDPDLRVSLALAFEANSLWEEAEAAWDAALGFDPDHGLWITHKAAALSERGATLEALAAYQRALELDPALDAARHRLGRLQIQLGKDELALATFGEVVRRQPIAYNALIGMAEALNNLGREAESKSACERALKLNATYKRAHYVLGIALRGLGRLEEAERELALGADSKERFLNDSLTVKLNSYRRGYGARIQDALDLVGTGQAQRAVPLLKKLLESHPTDRVVLVNLGVAQISVGNNSEAIEVLERALVLDPNDFAVLINLATAEGALQRLPAMLKHSQQAVRAAPNVSATYYVRAHAYMQSGRYGEAYTDLKKAAALDTDDARYPLEAAGCAVRLGRKRDALELYAAGLRLQPAHLPALVAMGALANQLGRRSVAEDAYRQAVALQPDHERVLALGKELGLR